MLTPIKLFFLSAVAFACVSCSSSSETTESPNIVSGFVSVDENTIPLIDAEMITLWQVITGQDYVYITTGGNYQVDTFSVDLPNPLPEQAINANQFAVGYPVAYTPGESPGEGTANADFDSNLPLGFTERHAIIYRTNEAEDLLAPWVAEFPFGYSCGLGVEAEAGDTFDIYVPVACSEMNLRIGDVDTFNPVNWS